MGLKLKKRIGTAAVSASMIGLMTLSASVFAADAYQTRFQEMYSKIHNPANGYFGKNSTDGSLIPYHAPETFIVEGPDYGHETTSETYSFYLWLEAMNGKFTKDFSGFKTAWDSLEKNIIPTDADQGMTSMSKYKPSSPATYAPEGEQPSMYPAKLDPSAPVGSDPINQELVSTYGTSNIYGMHWIIDTDNWYGFGRRGDGTSTPSYINTYQRGEQESTFETVTQPCWDDMKFGGKNGFLDLFTGDNTYSKQFKYTDAPDADARAVQATYWAEQWAKDAGVDLSTYTAKAAKLGDYLRYSFFDKYFRKIGDSSVKGTGYDSSMYLMAWYYAWGGSLNGDWSWIIGDSTAHSGYQNPFAAWVLSTDSGMKPKSPNAAGDWSKTLGRTIEFYQWLQSAEGGIAGGATNSVNGRYEAIPSGTSTFYGMAYVAEPVYHDPGSNDWFGMQTWTMQRLAQYYYSTKDVKAKAVLDKWVKWVKSEVKVNADGTFLVPSTLEWSGQPDKWEPSAPGSNAGLHVKVKDYGTDLGVTGSLCNTLLYYAKATGDDSSRVLAKTLLDDMWTNYKDDKGIATPEARADFKRLFDKVYVPSGWTGKMPNGDVIDSNSTFISIRSKYKQDPSYSIVKNAIDLAQAPTLTYHRFWAQTEIAVANGTYSILFGGVEPVKKGDLNDDKLVNSVDQALMKRYLTGTTTSINKGNADINNDGIINSIDAALLKRALLGTYTLPQ